MDLSSIVGIEGTNVEVILNMIIITPIMALMCYVMYIQYIEQVDRYRKREERRKIEREQNANRGCS